MLAFSSQNYDREEPLPDQLIGDHIRMKQVLINLIKNVLKFTHSGQIIIKAAYDDQDEKLYIHIVDNGKGFKIQLRNKLFQTFGNLTQSSDEDDADLAQMSMGLAISQKIVEKCGGDSIEFYDAGEAKGSTIMFSMTMKKLPPVKIQANITEE